MTLPLLSYTNACCKWADKVKLSENTKAVLRYGSLAFDTCASLTCLVVGILGIVGVIGMPTGAAYALIGVSGGITLLWIPLALLLVLDACSSKEE